MKTAFAIAAHPDDIEILMSGTLMRLAAAGYEIHYWNLANGSCGTTVHTTEEIIKIRRNEAIEAAKLIGAHYHESICNDLEIFYEKPTLARVASVIREVAPQIILTHSLIDYMEDHTNTARLVVTGAFSRSMPNFPVDPHREPTNQPVTIYHAQPYSHYGPMNQPVTPDLFVDTTDLMEKKTQMLALHQTQKLWLDQSQGLDSYLTTLRDLDAEAGQMSGRYQYAEGWQRHLHLGFCEKDVCPLSTALVDD